METPGSPAFIPVAHRDIDFDVFSFELTMCQHAKEPRRIGVQVDQRAFDRCLESLPRDRDLPLGFGRFLGATQRAEEQQGHRLQLARHIARGLVAHVEAEAQVAILKLMEQGDTIKGYSPEEYRVLHAAGVQP